MGVLDVNLDYAVLDNLSLGLTASYFAPGARATFRIGQTSGFVYGVTLGGGVTPNVWGGNGQYNNPLTWSGWFQPALDLTFPLGDAWKLRGTIGPLFTTYDGTFGSSGYFLAWPNLELSYAINGQNELTLGGHGIAGWKGSF